MKKSVLQWAFALCTVAMLGSCSKSSNSTPQPATVVVLPATSVTAYSGTYTYTDGTTGKVVVDNKAKATVTDKGNGNYSIQFSSSGAPTVTFVVAKTADGNYANVDYSSSKGIAFKENSLEVGIASSNPVYTLSFAGTR